MPGLSFSFYRYLPQMWNIKSYPRSYLFFVFRSAISRLKNDTALIAACLEPARIPNPLSCIMLKFQNFIFLISCLVKKPVLVCLEHNPMSQCVLFRLFHERDPLIPDAPELTEKVDVVLFLCHLKHGVCQDKSSCPPNSCTAVNENWELFSVGIRFPVLPDQVQKLLRILRHSLIRPWYKMVVNKEACIAALLSNSGIWNLISLCTCAFAFLIIFFNIPASVSKLWPLGQGTALSSAVELQCHRRLRTHPGNILHTCSKVEYKL